MTGSSNGKTGKSNGATHVIVTAAIDRQVRRLDEADLRWGREQALSVDTERVGMVAQKFVIDVVRRERQEQFSGSAGLRWQSEESLMPQPHGARSCPCRAWMVAWADAEIVGGCRIDVQFRRDASLLQREVH